MEKKQTFKVKAAIFDMDGVITNTMPDHFRAWRQVMRSVGIELTHSDIYSREGQRGITSVREFYAERNMPFSVKVAHELLHKKERLFQKIVRQRFVPGARSLLRLLRRERIILALVTGTSRRELRQILPAYLRAQFAVIVTGNDVRNGKPDPEPYLLALRRLGISARDAVVIENAPFGIRSARAAGLKCLAIATSLPLQYLTQAQAAFQSMNDLKRSLRFSRKPDRTVRRQKKEKLCA